MGKRLTAAGLLAGSLLLSGCVVENQQDDPATTAPSASGSATSLRTTVPQRQPQQDPQPREDPQPQASPAELPNVEQLCTKLQDQFQNLRTYGPTIGRVTLNTVVADWGFANNVDLLQLMANRSRVDTALEETCPQVRTEALDYLELTSIAAGLVGNN